MPGLLAFPDPPGVDVQSAKGAALAVGAAALWAAGTVLGRMVSAELSFLHITTLRFTVGVLTLAGFAFTTQTPVGVPLALVPRLVLLALVPGLFALVLYYYALRQTPASRARWPSWRSRCPRPPSGSRSSGRVLDVSQWLGFGIVLVSIVLLALHERGSAHPAVPVPDRAEDALSSR